MKMTNRRLLNIAFLPAALSLTLLSGCRPGHDYCVNVTGSGDGWGYDILYSDKVIIHQPFIPALPGNHPFAKREAAKKTGRLVAERLGKKRSPRLSAMEVDSIIRVTR
jgi:hypothetical protein